VRQHSTPVRRVPPISPPAPGRATQPVRRNPRRTAATTAATVAASAAVLAALLSGCGIRDTAVPVDAGDPASRTACPPGPSASLTALERDASLIPTAAPTRLLPPLTTEEQQASAAAAAKAKAAAGAAARSAAAASSAAGLTPSAVAGPTASDGTLACLHPSETG
jgi:hypothetical protein